jgi:hypothetical protein
MVNVLRLDDISSRISNDYAAPPESRSPFNRAAGCRQSQRETFIADLKHTPKQPNPREVFMRVARKKPANTSKRLDPNGRRYLPRPGSENRCQPGM